MRYIEFNDLEWGLLEAARDWMKGSGIKAWDMRLYTISGYTMIEFRDGGRTKQRFRMTAEVLERHDSMDDSWREVTTIYKQNPEPDPELVEAYESGELEL